MKFKTTLAVLVFLLLPGQGLLIQSEHMLIGIFFAFFLIIPAAYLGLHFCLNMEKNLIKAGDK